VFYSFPGGADGALPIAGVTLDSAGNLYGTTPNGGGVAGEGGAGVVFKLDGARNYTVLHSFTGGADGGAPEAGLTFGSAGNLYGTCPDNGAADAGGLFKIALD
jgi:uncharacterized repeat protein (TIGR03803 family)